METLKAKGVGLRGTNLTHDAYVMAYLSGDVTKVPQVKFTTTNHQLYTTKSEKIALHCIDDKRYWTSRNESLPYGHYSIRDVPAPNLTLFDV